MDKNVQISLMLDYYGDFLTPHQQKILRMYYDEDHSLAESAQLEGITRQGVRDAIQRGEATLFRYEQCLGLLRRYEQMRKEIDSALAYIEDVPMSAQQRQQIQEHLRAIVEIWEGEDGI